MDRNQGPLQAGDQFGKYEIRGLLGRGGHAYVYRAFDPFLDLEVAIKIIPSSRETGKDLAARARAEARVLVRLSHENVVKVADAGGTEDGLVYLVMELLTGRDLRKVLDQYGRLSVAEALTAAIQVSDGVSAAHRLGAIHRDLKPENVFIEPGNVFKVLDFGIAKVMGYGAPTTQKDLLHGTVIYMPPEQLKGFGVTERSDMFSLATLLYEALYRHPLMLDGTVPAFREAARLQIERMPPLLSDVDPAIPAYVARFVQRAIAKNPEQRYGSMAEMAQAARTALGRFEHDAKSTGRELVHRDLSVRPQPEAGPISVGDRSSAGSGRLSSTDDATHAPHPPGISPDPKAQPKESITARGLPKRIFTLALVVTSGAGLIGGAAYVALFPKADSGEARPASSHATPASSVTTAGEGVSLPAKAAAGEPATAAPAVPSAKPAAAAPTGNAAPPPVPARAATAQTAGPAAQERSPWTNKDAKAKPAATGKPSGARAPLPGSGL